MYQTAVIALLDRSRELMGELDGMWVDLSDTAMCTTSFTPPWRALRDFKFGMRIQSRLIATNCTYLGSNRSERLLGCKNFSCSRSVFHSVVIFVKYREVSTRTILPCFIGNYRDSVVFAFWWRRGQKREKEEAYIR